MKRFYTEATLAEVDGGWQILLDGKPVRTPARNLLIVPTHALGERIANEWRGQGEEIAPLTMKATGLANAAIDIIAPDPAAFVAPLAAYGESDLLCYRAPERVLGAAQAAAWNPLLEWAERSYGVDFTVTSGVMHVPQPPATVMALGAALANYTPFALAALSPVISIGGSLVAALALAARVFAPEILWDAVTLDERWQEQQWGEDADAVAVRAARHLDWQASAAFLDDLR